MGFLSAVKFAIKNPKEVSRAEAVRGRCVWLSGIGCPTLRLSNANGMEFPNKGLWMCSKADRCLYTKHPRSFVALEIGARGHQQNPLCENEATDLRKRTRWLLRLIRCTELPVAGGAQSCPADFSRIKPPQLSKSVAFILS